MRIEVLTLLVKNLTFIKEIHFFAKDPQQHLLHNDAVSFFFFDLLIHLMRWLLLCLPDDSSTPQIFHLFLCNCAPTDHSGKKINKTSTSLFLIHITLLQVFFLAICLYLTLLTSMCEIKNALISMLQKGCDLPAGKQNITCTFQIWTHLSKDPLARYLPSGLKATLQTGSWCLVRVWRHRPCSTSHNLTVESKDALEKKKHQTYH